MIISKNRANIFSLGSAPPRPRLYTSQQALVWHYVTRFDLNRFRIRGISSENSEYVERLYSSAQSLRWGTDRFREIGTLAGNQLRLAGAQKNDRQVLLGLAAEEGIGGQIRPAYFKGGACAPHIYHARIMPTLSAWARSPCGIRDFFYACDI